MLQRIVYLIEAAAAYVGIGLVRAIPIDWASALGGRLLRAVGPRLGVSRRAARNLARAMPEMPADEVAATIRGMWENLGRTAAEYPHLREIWDDRIPEDAAAIRAAIAERRSEGETGVFVGDRVEIAGLENADRLLAHEGPVICFSGHFGNWEVLPCFAARIGIPIAVVYRAPNNPIFAKILERLRGAHGPLLPKGAPGALASVGVLRTGGRLGMLMDQKQNRGIAVPFFGRPAMTAPTIAKLALRFRCPIFGAWVQRLDGARFRVTFAPPIDVEDSGSEDADVLAVLVRINEMLEAWARERPDQWLWMHRRWRE